MPGAAATPAWPIARYDGASTWNTTRFPASAALSSIVGGVRSRGTHSACEGRSAIVSRMARSIAVRFGDEESAFAFTKVEREKLYGKKDRVVVDETGRECDSAWLTPDGALLVPMGGTAHLWMDERWDAREQAERVAVDPSGTPLPQSASTLGIVQPLTEIDPKRVLEIVTSGVYQLDPQTLGEKLAEALKAGRLFELPFAYRDGYEQDLAILLANDKGMFALVGRPSGFAMIGRDVVVDDGPIGPDELDGDLDFGML